MGAGIVISVIRSGTKRYNDDYYNWTSLYAPYGYRFNHYVHTWYPSFGIGVWSSVVTIVAGSLGICTNGTHLNRPKLIAHIVMSFIALTGEYVTFISAATIASLRDSTYWSVDYQVMMCIITLISITQFALLISSIVYSFRLIPNCCSDLCKDVSTYPQTVFVSPNQNPQGMMMMVQQPGRMQVPQPGMYYQTQNGVMMQYQPGVMMQPQPGVMMQPQPGVTMQSQPEVTMQSQPGIAMQSQPGATMQPNTPVNAQGQATGVYPTQQAYPVQASYPVQQYNPQPNSPAPSNQAVAKEGPPAYQGN